MDCYELEKNEISLQKLLLIYGSRVFYSKTLWHIHGSGNPFICVPLYEASVKSSHLPSVLCFHC